MTTFNFTVRAIDDLGAFADRDFSIKIRNTLVDRFVLTTSAHAYTSTDGLSWTQRPNIGASTISNNMNNPVIYGNGKWMIKHNIFSQTYRLSSDGINWVDHTMSPATGGPTSGSSAVFAMSFVNGRFCFVASDSGTPFHLFTSMDGLTWTKSASAFSVTNFTAGKITYGGGRYVITNINSSATIPYVTTVDDGQTWQLGSYTTMGANPSGRFRAGFNYINGLWIAPNCLFTTTNNQIMYSNDFVTWNARTITFPVANYIPNQIVYGNGVLVMTFNRPNSGTGSTNSYMTSLDGINWTTRTLTANFTGTSSNSTLNTFCHYFNGKFYLMSDTNSVIASERSLRTSVDGVNWESSDTLPSPGITGFAVMQS